MLSGFHKFLANEDGATAIEYGLIAALIGTVIVGALASIGDQLKVPFQDVVAGLTSVP